jgi:hypothetical protein
MAWRSSSRVAGSGTPRAEIWSGCGMAVSFRRALNPYLVDRI